MSWRIAARYVNWLHNGKKDSQEAFESGVYDTSTFTENPDGSFNDQITHSLGAAFWIPTLDEWLKAVYYDPTLNGNTGGWWEQPGSSDDPLTVGPPGEGQTNASAWTGWDPAFPLGAGFYPEVQTPWGLLDASGGMAEWTEELYIDTRRRRVAKGSSFFSDDFSYQFEDEILHTWGWMVDFTAYQGLRISSAIPGPQSVWILALGCCNLLWKRRERCEERRQLGFHCGASRRP